MAVGHKEFAQKKPLQLVYLELGVGNGGMLLSVSEDGFRFRAVSPVRENGTMPFAFSLDGRNRLEGGGTVDWLEEDGKSGGMRFSDVSPEFRATLSEWLNSDSSHSSGREAAPAAATPPDAMEKIRQELRAGYPPRPSLPAPPAEDAKVPEQKPEPESEKIRQKLPAGYPVRPASPPLPAETGDIRQELRTAYPARPASPARPAKDAKLPEQKPQPELSAREIAERRDIAGKNVPEKNNSTKIPAEKSLAETLAVPPKAKQRFFEPASEKKPESKEPSAAQRLFPLPPASASLPEKPAAAPSAFLKPPGDAKTSGKPRRAADSPSLLGTRDAQAFSPTSVLFGSSPAEAESHAVAPARPYVPPLEESFEQAWERAKLSAVPESPHLSRAAAGGIIAIALAVILGALAYNFRQDIGSIFIQLGQAISGETRPAVPTPVQETKPDATPSDEQSQAATPQRAATQTPNATTESGNPSAGASNRNATTDATTTGALGTKPGAEAPAVVKPPENSVPGVVADSSAKNAAGPDAVNGQEEFVAARDILRGSNRQRDLPRAVELLWASVKKGHVPAEVMLADLYRRGDGVEKNCDQARVLLVAASKKGSLDAREMLDKIVTLGCE